MESLRDFVITAYLGVVDCDNTQTTPVHPTSEEGGLPKVSERTDFSQTDSQFAVSFLKNFKFFLLRLTNRLSG